MDAAGYGRWVLQQLIVAAPAPKAGELVRVRGQQWVVSHCHASSLPRDELAPDLPGRTLVTLASVSDDDLGDELTLVWEVEPDREVLPELGCPASPRPAGTTRRCWEPFWTPSAGAPSPVPTTTRCRPPFGPASRSRTTSSTSQSPRPSPYRGSTC